MNDQHIYFDELDCARDRIVERMYHDLDTGAFEEDNITVENLNTYCEAIYGRPLRYNPLNKAAANGLLSVGNLTGLVTDLFGVAVIQNLEKTNPERFAIDSKKYACRNHAWGDKTMYACHSDLGIALALMLVQDMRFEIIRRFTSGQTKQ